MNNATTYEVMDATGKVVGTGETMGKAWEDARKKTGMAALAVMKMKVRKVQG